MDREPAWDVIDAMAERFIALQVRERCGCTFEQYLANVAYYEKRLDRKNFSLSRTPR